MDPMTPEFAAAFVKMQGELPVVGKSRSGQEGNQKYRYADLATIMSEALPVMQANGFALIHKPITEYRDGVTVAGIRADLIHSSGHVETCEFAWEVTKGHGTLAKSVGSIITYARRYSMAIIGICTEDDDDNAPGVGSAPRGASAVSGAGKPKAKSSKPTPLAKLTADHVAELKSAAQDRLEEVGDNAWTIEELLDGVAIELKYKSRKDLFDCDFDNAMKAIPSAESIPF